MYMLSISLKKLRSLAKMGQAACHMLWNFEKKICPDLISITQNMTKIISQIFVLVACPSGSFHVRNECVLCPVDSYQPKSGQISCLTCNGAGLGAKLC